MLQKYIKFSGVLIAFSSALLASGGGARAAKEAKAERYRVSPDEHFDSVVTEPHVVEQGMPIKGRAAKYLAGKVGAVKPLTASAAAQNHHLTPIDPNDLHIERLLRDANAAVLGSKEEADNLSAASGLMYKSKRVLEAANTLWSAAKIYNTLKDSKSSARSFAKSAHYFRELENFSNATQGYLSAGKLYKSIEKNQESAVAFRNAAELYEAQKQYKEALSTFQLASDSYARAQQYKEAIDIKWIMSEIYERAKKYKKAAAILEEIADIHNVSTKDMRRAAEAWLKAGYYYESALDFDKSGQFFSKAQSIYKDLKLDRLVAQMETLIISTRDMTEPVKAANQMRDAAQKKYLDLQRSGKEVDAHDREMLQALYYDIAQKYDDLGVFQESAKALRNAGGFSIKTAHRTRFYNLAAAKYKKAHMNTEMIHMIKLAEALNTPKEQEALPLMEPLI